MKKTLLFTLVLMVISSVSFAKELKLAHSAPGEDNHLHRAMLEFEKQVEANSRAISRNV